MEKNPVQYMFYKQWGNKIFFRYKLDGGTETYSDVIEDYAPTLFTPTHLNFPDQPVSIYSKPLYQVQYNNIKEAKQDAETKKNMGLDIYGNSDFGNQFIVDLYDGKEVEYEHDIIRTAFLDIEVDVRRGDPFPVPVASARPINAVTLYDSIDKKYHVYGLPSSETVRDFNARHDMEDIDDCDIVYNTFTSEKELILSFLAKWRDTGYDILSGWNSEGFDVPYIWFRCSKVVGEKYTKRCLSPFGIVNVRERLNKYNKTYHQVDIMGICQMDYEEVYRKFVLKPRANYKLDYIGDVELGEKKVDYSEYGGLAGLYKDNYPLFIKYNIQDVRLLVKLEEKLKLLQLAINIMYMTSANLQDTLGTVKQWECFIAKELYGKNIAPLYHAIGGVHRDFEGAYVKEIVPDMYKWVYALDLNSLYPHLIMQGWIGPDSHVARHTITDERLLNISDYNVNDFVDKKVDTAVLKEYGYAVAPNGEFYDLSKPCFLAEMMQRVYGQRKSIKGEMLQHERNVESIEQEMQRRGLKV